MYIWIKNHQPTYKFDPKTMSCTIDFKDSKFVFIIAMVIPLVFVLSFAIYTLIRCYLYFKSYPEALTKKLLCELISANKVVSDYGSCYLLTEIAKI